MKARRRDNTATEPRPLPTPPAGTHCLLNWPDGSSEMVRVLPEKFAGRVFADIATPQFAEGTLVERLNVHDDDVLRVPTAWLTWPRNPRK